MLVNVRKKEAILKVSKDGKSENITIRVTEDLKKRAEELWKTLYSALPFNTFLGQMIDVGLKEEKMWLEIKEKRADFLKNDVLRRTMLEGKENSVTNGIPKERFEQNKIENAEKGAGLVIQEDHKPLETDIKGKRRANISKKPI
jgi:hypothetical protein